MQYCSEPGCKSRRGSVCPRSNGEHLVNMGAALEATRYERDSCGWCGETIIALPRHADKELVLYTRKPSFQSGLLTTASVRKHVGNGLMEFGTDSFYRGILRSTPKRITQKAVREQHTKALRDLDVIAQQAVAYYVERQRQAESARQQALALAA